MTNAAGTARPEGRREDRHEGGDPPARCDRDGFYAPMVQWARVRQKRATWPTADAAYDGFIDRIFGDAALEGRATSAGTLQCYWRRSWIDACRKAARMQSRRVFVRELVDGSSRTPLEQLLAHESTCVVQEALDSLSRFEQGALRLRLAGLHYREIGRQLGVSEGTARSLFARGRASLSQHPAIRSFLRA